MPALRYQSWHALVVVAAGLLLLPWLASDRWMTVANLAAVSVVGSVGLMILTGFTGPISLGHSAFLAIGAYTAALAGQQWHLPFWLVIPLAGCLGAAVGLAIGAFSLRLEGLQLAIVTIGLVYLVQHVLRAMPGVTGGASGTAVPMYVLPFADEDAMRDVYAPMAYGPVVLDFSRKLYFVLVAVAGLCVWMASNLRKSSAGLAMIAVRDHELAASALGVDPARTKLTAFVLSSLLAAVAGAMFGLQQQYVTIEPFDLSMSVDFIAMIVIGGVGTVFGAVAGALAFVVLTPVLEEVGSLLPLISELSSALQSTVLFSALVCAFLLFEPRGLYGVWVRVRKSRGSSSSGSGSAQDRRLSP